MPASTSLGPWEDCSIKLLSPPVLWLALPTIILTVAAYLPYRRRLLTTPVHRDVLAIATIAALAIGFFWRPIFESDAWIPYGGGDMASMLYPNYHFIGESLRRGELPLWNPYIFTGQPFASDIQTGIFYPVNLAFWLLVPEVTYEALEWLVVFHFFLAGFFAYVLLRGIISPPRLPIRRTAAVLGAAAFMFSDVMVTHIGNLNLIAVIAWLPLVFLFFHRAVVDTRIGYAVAGAVALGISFLAGHVQPFLYTIIALALYFAFHVYQQFRVPGQSRRLLRSTAMLLCFAVVTAGLIAIQLLPSRELADLSVRSEIDYSTSTEYSLPPSQLISLLIPNFFGRGPADYWGQWLRTETGYIGVFTLLAAILAVLLRRERIVYFLAGLSLAGLLLALGGYTVLQGWVFELLPGFDKMRAPARFLVLFDFGVAALAAMGLDAILRPLTRRQRDLLSKLLSQLGRVGLLLGILVVPGMLVLLELNRAQPEQVLHRITGTVEGTVMFAVLLLVSIALLASRISQWSSRRTVGLMAVALVAFDLISAGHGLEITTSDPTAGYKHSAALDFLSKDTDLYRVDTDTNIWDIWQPNSAPLHNVAEVQGARHPMELASFLRYWSALGSRSTAMYDLLNAKYIVGRKGVPLDFSKWKMAFNGDPIFAVYHNVNVLPRAFVVHNSLVEPDLDRQIAQMRQPDFNPRQTVLVSNGEALSLPSGQASTATVTEYRNNELSVDVDAPAEGFLVLSEMYHTGWRATVDGRPAEVLRADYTFRAVRLSPGRHSVRLFFSPASWELGRTITVATLVIVLAYAAWALASSRRAARKARFSPVPSLSASPD